MTTTQRFAPEALSVRKGAKHNNFESSGSLPTSLDGVSVVLSPTAAEHQYSAPVEEGDAMRRLRRYGLMLSRYGLMNKRKIAHSANASIELVNAAERIVASRLYETIFGEDPTIGTVNLVPLAQILDRDEPSPSAMAAAMAYVGTQAASDLVALIKNEKVREVLESNYRDLQWACEHYSRVVQAHINKDGASATRTSNKAYRNLVANLKREITWGQNVLESTRMEMEAKKAKEKSEAHKQASGKDSYSRRKEDEIYGRRFQNGKRTLRQIVPSIDGWAPAILEKLPLVSPHTGRKGRKIVPEAYGKDIKFISREDTDPEQKIFGRYVRATGGVVIVDCSGSMSLDENDLRTIMDASAGTTVICYSDGGRYRGTDEPNIWLVASRGRRASALPEFPGGNGVDGPALEVGVSMRRHNEPVIWISDTRVTGARDIASDALRDWCLMFAGRHNIYIVRRPEEAATLLRQFQMGAKPKRKKYKHSGGDEV